MRNRSFHLPGLLGSAVLALSVQVHPASLHAQVEEELVGLFQDNAQGYAEPLTLGLAHAMNGGLFDSAAPLGPFGFDVGLRVTVAFPPNEFQSFEAVLPGTITWTHPDLGTRTYEDPYAPRDGVQATPTAVGKGNGVVLEPRGQYRSDLLLVGENPDDYNLEFPGGLDVPVVPLALAHVSVGLGFGTEVTVRFIPDVEAEPALGEVGAFGFGVKHDITNWFVFPLDVSIAYGRQSVTARDVLDGSSTQFGLVVGKGLGPLSLYGSGMRRSGSVDVSYAVENPQGDPGLPEHGTRLGFETELGSGSAFAVGARLQLLLLNVSGQYTLDDFPTLSIKVGLGLP